MNVIAQILDSLGDTLGKIRNDPMVIVGFIGQAVFMSRMLVQWIASERAGRSIVPVDFWYWSLAGSMILLAYAFYKEDPVFIVGQMFGFIVYTRNLMMIHRLKGNQKEAG
jgi:lipid-A-disaccharide synthase-like uncharacterized protein